MGEFGFWQSVRKMPENLVKVLFYETCFEESNINRKPLIWYKIKMKFEQKKGRVWFLAKCTKIVRKLRKSVVLHP